MAFEGNNCTAISNVRRLPPCLSIGHPRATIPCFKSPEISGQIPQIKTARNETRAAKWLTAFALPNLRPTHRRHWKASAPPPESSAAAAAVRQKQNTVPRRKWGCDGSILLDAAGGEKSAGPNANSLRGFDVIDTIKARVEAKCPGVVSCADILALALRGPTWEVPLGRRDSTTASQSLANANLPSSGSSLSTLISTFASKGLSATDMTALSGAHTIGLARCSTFRDHVYNDANINSSFAARRRKTCQRSGGDSHLAPMDVHSSRVFDNSYYQNLMARRGLFHSDQELFNGGSQDALVRQYSANPALFRKDFVTAMIKMGNINPLTGTAGQIRKNCRVVNR
nr:peroxidase P7-like [Lolium perenne]